MIMCRYFGDLPSIQGRLEEGGPAASYAKPRALLIAYELFPAVPVLTQGDS